MSVDFYSPSELLKQAIQKHQTMLKIIAGVFIVLGFYALLAPTTFALGIEKILGWTLFIAAVASFAHAFFMRQWRGFTYDVVSGLIFALIAFILLTNPLSGVISLGLIMAIIFGVDGAIKLIRLFTGKLTGSYRTMVAVSAILSLAIALLMLWDLPKAAPIFLSVIVGVNLIINGFGLLALVRAYRH
ncbi:HdeD family acid-resistance protein [Marinomonas posidonica]